MDTNTFWKKLAYSTVVSVSIWGAGVLLCSFIIWEIPHIDPTWFRVCVLGWIALFIGSFPPKSPLTKTPRKDFRTELAKRMAKQNKDMRGDN